MRTAVSAPRARGVLLLLCATRLAAVQYQEMGAAPTQPPSKKKFNEYLKQLRSELKLSMKGANITVDQSGAHAREDMEPNSLAMIIPHRYVLTVQAALGSGVGTYINKKSRELPKTLPRHWILAMWLLFEKHMVRHTRHASQ